MLEYARSVSDADLDGLLRGATDSLFTPPELLEAIGGEGLARRFEERFQHHFLPGRAAEAVERAAAGAGSGGGGAGGLGSTVEGTYQVSPKAFRCYELRWNGKRGRLLVVPGSQDHRVFATCRLNTCFLTFEWWCTCASASFSHGFCVPRPWSRLFLLLTCSSSTC